MNITQLSEPVKSLFRPAAINQLARESKFVKRLRGLQPSALLAALSQVLGTQSEANIADIHRALVSHSPSAPAYKPFHNQLKKAALTTFLQRLVSRMTEQLLLKPFAISLPDSLPFTHIHVHDGSTLKLHDALKHTFAGRFTKTIPAAVELHLTMDLLRGSVEYLGIDADKESERLYQPYANESAQVLHLMDAGYFDIEYICEIKKHHGHCIMRAKSNINPTILSASDANGQAIRALVGTPLKSLKLAQGEVVDLCVTWKKAAEPLRVIASWDKRQQRIGYLITTLDAATISAQLVLHYYSLRWQVELLFKELKSYCNLTTFATRNQHIAETLIWASIAVMLIKRFLAFGTAALFNMIISTEKVQRSAVSWMHYWVVGVGDMDRMDEGLINIVKCLQKVAPRAHPKRDEGTLAMELNLFSRCFAEENSVKM